MAIRKADAECVLADADEEFERRCEVVQRAGMETLQLANPADAELFVTRSYDQELLREVIEPNQFIKAHDEDGTLHTLSVVDVDTQNGVITYSRAVPPLRPSELFPAMTHEQVRSMPIQYAKGGIAKHKARQNPKHIKPPAVTSASLLLKRVSEGGDFIVPSTREARAMMRKAMHAKRKAER